MATAREAKRWHLRLRRAEFNRRRNSLALEMMSLGVRYRCAHEDCLLSENLTIDHKIAIVHGGTDDMSNLQFMCQRHNSMKGHKPPRRKPLPSTLPPAPRYIAVINKSGDGYCAVFPDLPECVARGVNVDEATRNATIAACEWATNAARHGVAMPPATLSQDIKREAAAILIMVPAIYDYSRPAKANITIDSGILCAIDDAAEARGLTRSAFVASAMREKIAAEG